ncbi:hypothetical protein [Enterococcus casseliflavus]
MTDVFEKELVANTRKFLKFVESNSETLEKDLYLYATYIEVCKVLASSVNQIEKKVSSRAKRQ